jgi:hypothetical protein
MPRQFLKIIEYRNMGRSISRPKGRFSPMKRSRDDKERVLSADALFADGDRELMSSYAEIGAAVAAELTRELVEAGKSDDAEPNYPRLIEWTNCANAIVVSTDEATWAVSYQDMHGLRLAGELIRPELRIGDPAGFC